MTDPNVIQMTQQELKNTVDIAGIKQELHGLRSQQEAHARSTQENFTAVAEKLDSVLATLNKGKGAFSFAIIAAGAIGGVIVKAASLLFAKAVP